MDKGAAGAGNGEMMAWHGMACVMAASFYRITRICLLFYIGESKECLDSFQNGLSGVWCFIVV